MHRYIKLYILTTCTSLYFLGCYTFTGTTLPPHLKTVQVDPVENQTLDPIFAERLTQAIKSGFETKGSLRAVNENGDCLLTAVLKTYTHQAYNTSGSDVTDYRVDISVHVRFYDVRRDKVLFEEQSLPGFGTYSVSRGETETTGQQAAIENVVSMIMDKTVSGW